MKKIFLLLFVLMFVSLQSVAAENVRVMNLHTGDSYIIPLKNRPLNLKNSNENIVSAEPVTNIFDADSSILLTTYKEGIAYITYKQKNETYTLKLLIDNKAIEDNDLIKLDKAEKPEKVK